MAQYLGCAEPPQLALADRIDVREAQATLPSDKEMIMALIANRDGGEESMNSVLRERTKTACYENMF